MIFVSTPQSVSKGLTYCECFIQFLHLNAVSDLDNHIVPNIFRLEETDYLFVE